ncbi:MAG: toluene tolerance protein [Gammaproteobacteria bacterium]|nr:MAG: toluene tolerance protein [Gammaproteobacteria bacterium]
MRITTTIFLQTLMAGLLCLSMLLPSAAENSAAVATVDNLHAALLDIMRNAQSLGFAGRRDRIAPVIRESLDLPFIARFALGRYWKDLSAGQQDAFVEVFSRWTVVHYASRFDGYTSEQFKTISSAPARRNRELVRTVLEVNDDPADNVSLDYLLHETDSKWRIVNVIANGVSDLSLKRADYGAVVKAQGLDSLIAKLEGQISDLEAAY